jgi:hypothetical protein
MLSVGVFAVSDADDQNNNFFIIYLIDHAVSTDAYSILIPE